MTEELRDQFIFAYYQGNISVLKQKESFILSVGPSTQSSKFHRHRPQLDNKDEKVQIDLDGH